MAEKRKYSRKYCKYTEAKVEFIDYKDIDIKGDWTNQNHPATSIDQTSLPLTIPSFVHLVPRIG